LPETGRPIPQRWLSWYREQVRTCEKTMQWFAMAFYCNRLLQVDPAGEFGYRMARARAAKGLGDWRQVEADLSRVLKLAKPTADIYFTRSEAYFGLGQYDRAEADLTQGLALDPQSATAWGTRGEVRARLRRWTDAVADYSRALALNDKGEVSWRLRGDARAELGQWDGAVADFAQALARAPTSASALFEMALADLGKGNLPAYRRDCVRMFERLGYTSEPSNWDSLTWVCCLAANKAAAPARLVELMDKAVAAQPKNWAYLNTRGAALYRAGRYADALSQLNKAVAVQGRGGAFEDWVFLAMAQFRLGSSAPGQDAWKRALALYNEGLKPSDQARPPLSWYIRVAWQQLRTEAQGLIEGTTKGP